MKKMLQILSVVSLTTSPVAAISCANTGDRVLVTIPNNSTAYNKVLANSILNELKEKGYSGKALYVNEDPAQEQAQLSTEIGMGGVKGVVAVPIDVKQSEPAYQQVFDENISVVAVDRTISNKDILIGETATDNVGGGLVAAEHLAKIISNKEELKSENDLKNKSVKDFYNKVVSGEEKELNVIEMIGDTTNSSSVERHKGFIQLLDKTESIPNTQQSAKVYSWSDLKTMEGTLYEELSKVENSDDVFKDFKVNYISSVYNWDEAKAKENFENIMAQNTAFNDGADVIITHNDPPATTIYQALEKKDTSHTLIYGFDGLKSTYDNYIKDGKITGTLIQDPQSMAKWAVETLDKKIKGEKVEFESHPVVPKNGLAGTLGQDGYGWINDKE